jgi:hypothetical protein
MPSCGARGGFVGFAWARGAHRARRGCMDRAACVIDRVWHDHHARPMPALAQIGHPGTSLANGSSCRLAAAALLPLSASEVEGPSSELSENSDTLSKEDDDWMTCRRLPAALLAGAGGRHGARRAAARLPVQLRTRACCCSCMVCHRWSNRQTQGEKRQAADPSEMRAMRAATRVPNCLYAYANSERALCAA